MPPKAMFEADKQYFEKVLTKVKRAHQIEIRNLKGRFRNNFFDIMKDKLKYIQEALNKEVIHLLD